MMQKKIFRTDQHEVILFLYFGIGYIVCLYRLRQECVLDFSLVSFVQDRLSFVVIQQTYVDR